MPRYKLQAPDGRTVTVEGPEPPDEAALDEIFASLPTAEAKPAEEPEPTTATGPSTLATILQRSGLSGLAGLIKGAAKEAPLVVSRAAAVPERATSAVLSEALERLGAGDFAQRMREQTALRKAQQEEPFVPTGEETGPEKLGRTVARAAPQVALAALTGGGTLPAQAAVLGGASAVQAAAEGAGPLETAVSGALGAAAPLVAPAVSGAGKAIAGTLERRALAMYNRALAPTKEATKTIAKEVVPEMIERGITAGPIKGLRKIGDLSEEQIVKLGQEIGVAYKNATKAGVKMNGAKLADALEDLKVPFTEVTQTEAGPQVVILNEGAVGAIDGLQKTLRELGPQATPSAIFKFRRVIDDVVTASNGFTKELPRGTARDISKQARASIAKSLTEAVRGTQPAIEQLNANYHFWTGVRSIIKETERRQTGQQGPSLFLAVVGGAGGASAGPGGAAAGTVLIPKIAQAIRSPFARTWTAVEMNALADILAGNVKALASPAGKKVATTLALFGVQATTSNRNAAEEPEG